MVFYDILGYDKYTELIVNICRLYRNSLHRLELKQIKYWKD